MPGSTQSIRKWFFSKKTLTLRQLRQQISMNIVKFGTDCTDSNESLHTKKISYLLNKTNLYKHFFIKHILITIRSLWPPLQNGLFFFQESALTVFDHHHIFHYGSLCEPVLFVTLSHVSDTLAASQVMGRPLGGADWLRSRPESIHG
jgi:hypothetical protein